MPGAAGLRPPLDKPDLQSSVADEKLRRSSEARMTDSFVVRDPRKGALARSSRFETARTASCENAPFQASLKAPWLYYTLPSPVAIDLIYRSFATSSG
jgi:hypothetical protein